MVPLALLIIGLQINPTIGAVPYWLGIGWFSHLFYDYKTQGGIVLFYPISLYTTETLGDTEFIAPMHFFGYWGPKTGTTEETRSVVISCTLWLTLAFMIMPFTK